MPEQNPNSVLFSLEELRRIEEERVAAEAEAKHQAVQRAEQARRDAQQAQVDAEEAARQAAEEQARADRESRERADREERIRIAEAERKARVEAEVRLQQDRITAEAEASAKVKAHKLRNTIMVIVGVAAVLLGGLGYFLYLKSAETDRKQALLVAERRAMEKIRKEAEDKQRLLEAERAASEKARARLTKQLATAKTDAERAMLKRQIVARNARERAIAKAKARARARAKRRGKIIKKRKGNDPLGGLGI